MRTGTAVLATASVVLIAACGGGGSTPSAPSAPAPTPASRAEVTVTITPASPVAQPNDERTYPWQVAWTLVLKETAGLGGNVNYVAPPHLDARGELQIPLSMIYRADGFGGRTITLKNAVSFTDDRGNPMMLGASATVVSENFVRF